MYTGTILARAISVMPGHRIIVIGASAGGVAVLQTIMSELPQDLDAAILVVVHILPCRQSHLPEILNRSGPLRAMEVCGAQAIQPGRIYVAPADAHVVVDNGTVDLWHGPKENQHRPAINPLFRSAAVLYGPRVIGVVLTGALDDGSAGLWWVKRHGGVAIVQDPETAQHPDMPRNAIQYVDVDYVAPPDKIAGLLRRLVSDNTELRKPEWELSLGVWSPSKLQ